MGPVVTARFGAGLLYLAALAIFSQVVYNIEISRYTPYSGEPIFHRKIPHANIRNAIIDNTNNSVIQTIVKQPN